MAYTLVPTELIVDGAITSAKLDTNIAISGTLGVTGEVTLATHLIMGDNDKIKIGTGGDLEIYHDGSNSYISNSTGNIYLADTNGAVHIQAKLNEESIVCAADGAVTLYHDNAVRLATSSAGVSVTGTVSVSDNISNAGAAGSASVFNEDGTTADFRVESTSNTHMLFVDGGLNRVGIGTSSPLAPLVISNGGAAGIELHPEITTDTNSIAHYDRTASAYMNSKVDALTHQFLTSGSEKMRIDSSGKVGIATSTNHAGSALGYMLTIDSEGASGSIFEAHRTGNSRLEIYQNATGGNYIDSLGTTAFTAFATSGTERMRIDSSGRILIGTTSSSGSSVRLEAHDATNPIIQVKDTTSNIICGIQAGNAEAVIRCPQDSPLVFNVGASETERMRINASGQLGIACTDQSNLLTVDANSASAGTDSISVRNRGVSSAGHTAGLRFQFGTAVSSAIRSKLTNTSNGEGTLSFFTSSDGSAGNLTERWRIDSSGRMTNAFDATGSIFQVAGNSVSGGVVGILDPDVSVSTGNVILQLTFTVDQDATNGKFAQFSDGNTNCGSISAASGTSVSYNTTSDERLKKNIVDASSQLNVIKNIKVREFDWKSNNNHDVGMIAQELNTVIPNVVIEGSDEHEMNWGVDYGKLTPYLIKAIQEQQTVIEDLKSRIETLEG
jgi:hypothetical protein